MSYNSSTKFDSYIPVYDAIPDDWVEAKTFLIERLKEHANAINLRAIGWMLDEELISGFQLTPPVGITGSSEQYRTVLRKTFYVSPLNAGVNNITHGILIDQNFTLVDIFCAATDVSTPISTSFVINSPDVTINQTTINITSPKLFQRAIVNVLYSTEL